MKDQLLIVLMKRLVGKSGVLRISVAEIDDTGNDVLMMALDGRTFEFQVKKKKQ